MYLQNAIWLNATNFVGFSQIAFSYTILHFVALILHLTVKCKLKATKLKAKLHAKQATLLHDWCSRHKQAENATAILIAVSNKDMFDLVRLKEKKGKSWKWLHADLRYQCSELQFTGSLTIFSMILLTLQVHIAGHYSVWNTRKHSAWVLFWQRSFHSTPNIVLMA